MTEKKLTKKEREVLHVMKDPVLWVTQHIGKPRWYQELVLRHPHHRIVLRMGRRLGKCIAAGERILDPSTGKYETIDNLYHTGVQQPHLYTLDDSTMSATDAFHIEDNGIKDVYEVMTEDGSRVKLTENHPVLTQRGWIAVGDLHDDDELALPTKLPYTGSKDPDSSVVADAAKAGVVPEDIYEWRVEKLEEFLLTYLREHSVSRLHGGWALVFDEYEEAREFKHLFLRVGHISKLWLIENKHWVLDVFPETDTGDDYYFSPLKEITYTGKEQTYDVHVPKTHNLVVEDVFVHNTWTMTSHMLWVAMTNWGGRLADRKVLDLLVVTPYDVQAKEIYDKLLEMIADNEALSTSLDYNKQGPPREIKFLNGNTIKLFTAGTSSSSNAASLRGQRADSCRIA